MQPASLHQPTFPERVGKYELLLPIGTGGMATVYLARAVGPDGLEHDFALKLVHAHLRADKESKLHLLEEAKLAALIQHPNVIRVLEIDEDPFGVFLVMEYVEGDSLSGLARAAKEAGTPLGRRLIARILNDALLGLHAAHELKGADGKTLGLVHRDFSPQNILVSVHGQTRLGDFGVAKAADRAVRTKTGLTKGKIAYMSPEQARGHAVDRRCDVWAAGVLTWELLAQRRLYRSDDDVATLLSIVTEQPPRLSQVLSDIPSSLDDAIASALQPTLDARCPTAEEFRSRLASAWADGDGMAEPAELAEFMRLVISPELAERNARIEEVKSLRQRSAVSAGPASGRQASGLGVVSTPLDGPEAQAQTVSELPSAPGQDSPRYGAVGFSDSVLEPPEDSVTTVAYAAGRADLLPRRGPANRPPEELTETSAVVPTWQGSTHSTKRRVAALSLSAVAAVGLVVWLGSGVSGDSGPGTSSTEQSSDNALRSGEVAPAEPSAKAEPRANREDTVAQPDPSGNAAHPAAPKDSASDQAESAGPATRTPHKSAADTREGSGAEPSSNARKQSKVRKPSKAGKSPTPTPAPAAPDTGSKPGTREKPKLATSPYAGPKSGE